jgi:hypothetical protein
VERFEDAAVCESLFEKRDARLQLAKLLFDAG